MALTNNLKPSGFQPVGGGSLIYQWTESVLTGKTNYRVVLQFNGYTATLPDFEFRPDADGVIVADIAPILRSLLTLDETVASRMINTYVKYQAVWDESSDAQVNLSGDVIYAYVGNNNSLNYRTKFDVSSSDANINNSLCTGVFLLDKLATNFWVNRTSTVDFLCDGSLPSNSRFNIYADYSLVLSTLFDGTIRGMYSFPVLFSTASSQIEIDVSDVSRVTHYAWFSPKLYEECENPIHLKWINDYGGIQDYIFDYNQLFGFQIGSNERYKELECFAYGVTMEQWLMLNELNRSGLIYNDNYKQGQFVQDVTTYSDPVDVVVQQRELSTQTKRVSHDFRVNIRYPLIPNTDV